jgi:hypothetical protein
MTLVFDDELLDRHPPQLRLRAAASRPRTAPARIARWARARRCTYAWLAPRPRWTADMPRAKHDAETVTILRHEADPIARILALKLAAGR